MLTSEHPRWTLVLSVVISWLLLAPESAFTGGANPEPFILTQPNGVRFSARSWGDERQNGTETVQGYTILQEHRTRWWVYAVRDDGGKLVPSQSVVGGSAPVGIPPHLREEGPSSATVISNELGTSAAGLNSSRARPGTHRLLVIVVDFTPSVSLGTTESDWEQYFFTGPRSVWQYWNAASYGNISLEPAAESYGAENNGIVFVTLPYPHPSPTLLSDASLQSVVRDAIVAARSFVNFAAFDVNNDGFLNTDELHLFFVIRGYEESYGGVAATCTDRPRVWAQRGFFRSSAEAPVMDGVVVGDLLGAPTPGAYQGGYAVMGEWHCRTPDDSPGHMATVGVAAHELSHDLGTGAPDLYGFDGSVGPNSFGVGRWSLQGLGFWNGSEITGQAGTHPALPDPWTRWRLGFLTPTEITTPTRAWLPQIETATDPNRGVFQLQASREGVEGGTPGGVGTLEYFLVENRQRVGDFDVALPGDGLLIWHIDESVFNPNARGDAPESLMPLRNRFLVVLEQADGRFDLACYPNPPHASRCNAGDSTDPWKTGIATAFRDTSTPISKRYDGSAIGVSVTDISDSGAWMSATLNVPPSASAQSDTLAVPVSMHSPVSSDGSQTLSGSGDNQQSPTGALAVSNNLIRASAGMQAAGNGPGFDSLTVMRLNNIRYCDQFPGADAAAKITACIADLPLTGGTADARGFEGTQTISADPFSGANKPLTLLLGCSTFLYSAKITVPRNVAILGSGNCTTFTQQAGTNLAGAFMEVASSASNVVLDGFTIDGNRSNNTSTAAQHVGIGFLSGSSKSVVRRVTVRDFIGNITSSPDVGISISTGTDILIEGCTISNMGTIGGAASDGIYTSGSRNHIMNNFISNASDTGIVAEASTDPLIANNTILNTPAGIAIDSAIAASTTVGGTVTGNIITGSSASDGAAIRIFKGAGLTTSRVVVTGNVIRDATSGSGIEVNGSSRLTISGNLVTNHAPTVGKHGILILDSDTVTITGNIVDGAGGHGFALGGITNFTFSGNAALNNSLSSSGTYSGIVIGAGAATSSDGTLTGNKSRGANQGRGLVIFDGSDNIFIAGNDLRFNKNNPGYLNSTGGNVRLGYNLTNDNPAAPEVMDYLSIRGTLNLSTGTAIAGTLTQAITAPRTWTLPDSGGTIALRESPVTGEITGTLSSGFQIAPGVVTDAKVASPGITTRSKLPATLAYEDEPNTFTQNQSFTAGVGIGTTPTDDAGLRIATARTSNIWSGPPLAFFSTLMQGAPPTGTNVFGTLNTGKHSLIAVAEDNGTGAIEAINAQAQSTHPAGTKATTTAIEGDAWHSGAGTLSDLTGVCGLVFVQPGAGNVSGAQGLSSYVEHDSAATTAEMAGVLVGANARTAGTVTNNYGVKIQDQSGVGTNNWAIRTMGTAQSEFGGPIVGDKSLIAAVLTVTFSASPTFDASQGNSFKIILTDNVTNSTLSGATTGQPLYFIIKQDATGGHTFVWPTNVKGGMSIGTAGGKCSVQSFIVVGTDALATSSGVGNMTCD